MFIIFMGVSGCGKTTIGKMTAETLDVSYYEGDEYHPKENVDKMSRGIPLTDEDRDAWLEKLTQLIQSKLDRGESGVLSCSALKEQYRERLYIDPQKVHFIYLKGSYDLILKRLTERTDHYMPPKLLKSQFETLEEPQNAFTINIDQAPEAILQQALAYISHINDNPDT
ncbi:MAG: gluconokinase [Brevefilum sp.]|nr:gluconokinase [Brevefilum sp.]